MDKTKIQTHRNSLVSWLDNVVTRALPFSLSLPPSFLSHSLSLPCRINTTKHGENYEQFDLLPGSKVARARAVVIEVGGSVFCSVRRGRSKR